MATGGDHDDDPPDVDPAVTYRTVDEQGQAILTVRGSTFVSYVTLVEDVETAESRIDETATRHADATHVVPAYRVRVGDRQGGHLLREWSSDAGEPSGSAGKPALNVLAKRDLENALVIVVRWFGGTDLGVGGLARAYGQAGSLAVDDAGVVERRPAQQLVLEVGYDDSGTVRGLLESSGVSFDAVYEETVQFDTLVPLDEVHHLVDRLQSATGGRVQVD